MREMVRSVSLHKILLPLASLGLLFFWAGSVYAQAEKLSYLPSNDNMDTVTKDYSTPLQVLGFAKDDCEEANELFQQAEDCYNCIQNLKPACPDCCLTSVDDSWAVRCSENVDAKYNCPAKPFAPADCSSTNCSPDWDDVCKTTSTMSGLNHCQHNGCPSTEPEYDTFSEPAEICLPYGANAWKCNFRRPNARPAYPGCTANEGSTTSPCSGPPYYTLKTITEPMIEKIPPVCPNSDYPCWSYTPTSDFQDCIDSCKLYSNNWDTCNNTLSCCKRGVCSDMGSGGRDVFCELNKCQQRLEIPRCAAFTSSEAYTKEETCAKLSIAANNCVIKGLCSSCFKELDPAFFYKFVARSRQGVTIIWQMVTQPLTPTQFLYTKLKLFEISPTTGAETIVHESIIHQKSLAAAFSIFCATHVPPATLKPGKAYIARLYYFLPYNDKTTLKVDIKSMRLITIRSRE